MYPDLCDVVIFRILCHRPVKRDMQGIDTGSYVCTDPVMVGVYLRGRVFLCLG